MTEHTSAPVLTMPRRLAIQLLHEAQVAAPNRVCGLVSADSGGADRLHAGFPTPPLKLPADSPSTR